MALTARSDLLKSVVRASMSGDKATVRSTVKTIIADGYTQLCMVYRFDEAA